MGRRVITAKDVSEEMFKVAKATAAGPPPPPSVDDYKTRLLKYIPAEIVAAFVTIDGVIRSLTQPAVGVYWIVFAILLVLTPLYIWRVSDEPNKPPAKAQIIVSTIAFFVWVFALGGPFSDLGWYIPAYGALSLIIYTLIVPVFVGE